MLRTVVRIPFWAGTTALAASGLLLVASLGRTQVAPPPPGPPMPDAVADEPGMETLTQGPIHEAFANPAEMDPTSGPVTPVEPPQPITEEPPEYMPEGAQWIPGYWLWDDDRDEFIWVTGVARVPPPNMQWVPGYFVDAEGGWQRVAGFWASVEEPELEYRLTGPPETLEAGPSSPSPSEQHFWVPGNWAHYDTGYRWQGGYWAPYVENWVWVPARWVWTPSGYVFCQGFWDHRLAFRGQMFAPVHFQQPIYTRPAFVYRPWCVIPTNNLFIHLWIRPRWNCYYFGNYYGAQFAQRGFVPWANLTVGARPRYFYDPFFSYANVHYRRQGIDYIGRVQGWHRYFVQHEDLRPQRTWRQQQQYFARTEVRVETQFVARTVVDVARRQDTAVRLVRLDEQSARAQRQHADRLREFNQQRRQLEVSSRQPAVRRPDGDRGDDRDRPGRGDGKAGSLVDRAEGKASRDNKGGGPSTRPAPRLTIPRDLVASTPTVGRDRNDADRAGDENRGKAGKVAGGPQKAAAPPRPRPTSTAARDADKGGKGKAGIDDRQPKGVSKAADRQETPPSLDGRDRVPGGIADRDDTPGRGKAGDARPPARDAQPSIGRGKATDRDNEDRPGVAKGKAGDPTDRGVRSPGGPGVGDATARPRIPGEPPARSPMSPRGDNEPIRAPGTFGPRPDAGVKRPAGTITPGTINPDRLGIPKATPGGDRGIPGGDRNAPGAGRGTTPGPDRSPGINRGNDRTGSPSPFGGLPKADRPETPRTLPQATTPGRGNDGGARSGGPPRGKLPSARPDSDNRPGPPARGPKSEAASGRTEAFRPSLNREGPTVARPEPRPEARVLPRAEPPREARPMPRVEPPREARPMPRVETAREARPMPRIETARENRPASRSETPRPSPRSEASRPASSGERGPRSTSPGRSDSGSAAAKSDGDGDGGGKSKGKGRSRDN